MCNTSDDRISKYIYPSPPSPVPHPFRTFNHRSENNENAYRRDVALVATSASPTTWCPPSSSRGVAARRSSSLSATVASCASGHTSPATGTPRVTQGGGAAGRSRKRGTGQWRGRRQTPRVRDHRGGAGVAGYAGVADRALVEEDGSRTILDLTHVTGAPASATNRRREVISGFRHNRERIACRCSGAATE